MRKNSDVRLAQEESWNLLNTCYLCKDDEESPDRLLFHYANGKCCGK